MAHNYFEMQMTVRAPVPYSWLSNLFICNLAEETGTAFIWSSTSSSEMATDTDKSGLELGKGLFDLPSFQLSKKCGITGKLEAFNFVCVCSNSRLQIKCMSIMSWFLIDVPRQETPFLSFLWQTNGKPIETTASCKDLPPTSIRVNAQNVRPEMGFSLSV